MVSFNATKSEVIPPQTGLAIEVPAKSLIRLTDLLGSQIGDVFAFSSSDSTEWLSASHTRTAIMRTFPRLGEAFYTNRRRAILTLVEDTSPGVHDMFFAPCDIFRYQEFGVEGHHPNCKENFELAIASAGYSLPIVPDPVNIFQNSPANKNGELIFGVAASQPGDTVTFQAEMDLVFVVAACSMDLGVVNGGHCTELLVEVS